jgi:hypothetical protein
VQASKRKTFNGALKKVVTRAQQRSTVDTGTTPREIVHPIQEN